MRPLLYPSGLLAGIIVGAGCFYYQIPDHCFNGDGDRTCRDRKLGRYCNRCRPESDGCVDTKPAGDCHWAGPADVDSTSGMDSTAGAPTTMQSTTESSSDGSMEPICTDDSHCTDAAAPFCDLGSGTCVTCDRMADPDAACAEQSADTPLCVAERCVACTPDNPVRCEQDLLLCDGATNDCVPCTEHEQCEIGACQLAHEGGGRCFPPDSTVVEVTNTLDGGVYQAVTDVSGGGFGIIIVHAFGEGTPYIAGVHVEHKTIALLAADDSPIPPIIQGANDDPGIRVRAAGTTLYTDGLEVSRGSGVGVEVVDGARAWLDRSRIVQNDEGGISARGGAGVTLRNCFVGDDAYGLHALAVDDESSATILYTTLGAGYDARALRCSLGAMVQARNSLLVALDEDDDEIHCPGIDIQHSVTEQFLGGTNVDLPLDVSTSWFEDYGTGAFNLLPGHPSVIDTAALWRPGDPRTDIDGDLRPTELGPDFAGGDIPPSP